MKKLKMFFVALAILVSALANAQNIKVSGVVTDSSTGLPVPFAAVQVKGTMVGASSDANGEYSISVPANGTLVFTSIGYLAAEASVDGKSQLNVVLDPDAQALEETIVVAFGTAKKASFTGSAAVVDSETISQHVSSNVATSLAGTTPGVQVIQSSGDPTSDGTTIRIRGIGSISASNNPLIILDGMPYDGSLNSINPNDVESMSVLKDAAASALYGARGANGVVLITSKKAKSGDAVVKFDMRLGSNSRLIPQYDVITDPGEYYETHFKQMYNSQYYAGKTSTEAYAYAEANLYDQKNGGLGYQIYTVPEGQNLVGRDFKLNPNATMGYSEGDYYFTADDWYNQVYHNSFRQEYSLSVAGSGEKYNYYASFGYLNDGGVVANSNYERYTGRINADYQAKKWLKFNTSLGYTHSASQVPSYSSTYGSSGNIFYVCNMMAPIYPLYVRSSVTKDIVYDNGYPVYDYGQTGKLRGSITGNAIRNNTYDQDMYYEDVVNAKGGVVITPFKGFSLTANLGVFADNQRNNSLSSVFAGDSNDGTAYVSHARQFTVNQQYLAEYKTDFRGSKHNFDILAGYEQYQMTYQSLSGQNDHLYDPYIGELNNADGTESKKTNSYSISHKILGFLGQVKYDYAERYFLSASYRRDASSRFATGHRWGDFGSVGAAWLISSESWMSSAKWVNLLKLKASWGMQGNENLGSSTTYYYPYTDQYTHSWSKDNGYSSALAYKGNNDLTWESSSTANIGVEAEFWDGYLTANVEVFHRNTKDLLYFKDVPLSSGNPLGVMPVNVGKVMNAGVEFTLGGKIISTKNVHWDWNLNGTSYQNKILELDPSVAETGIKSSNSIMKVGGTLYDSYVRKYAGVNPETGKARWYKEVTITDTDDNGKEIGSHKEVQTTETFSEATQFECGSILPKFYGGFGTSLKLYGFDLSVQLGFQLGGQYYDGTYQALMHTSNGTGLAWHKDALNAWSPENPTSNIPRLDGDESVGQTACDCFFVSSNYLSVNNVTIGYSFPEKWMKKIKIAGLRIYFAGENLGVLTARKGIDPRYSMGLGGMTSGSGLNSGSYSAVRNLTGGLTVTF